MRHCNEPLGGLLRHILQLILEQGVLCAQKRQLVLVVSTVVLGLLVFLLPLATGERYRRKLTAL